MKKIIIATVVIAILVIAVAWIRGDRTPKKYPTDGEKVVAFGDSLVSGYGVKGEENFVSILANRIGQPIINAGVDGDTTTDGLARLSRDVLREDPKVVIVLLGGNDAIGRITKEKTFQNLEAIVDQIHIRGAAVVLVGVRGGLLHDRYDSDFKKLAKRKGCFFVSNILDDIMGHPKLMHDTIHPNAAGHQIMADRIEPELREALGL